MDIAVESLAGGSLVFREPTALIFVSINLPLSRALHLAQPQEKPCDGSICFYDAADGF